MPSIHDPVELKVVNQRYPSFQLPFHLSANNISTLLIEVVQLVKLTATQGAELQAISSNHALRAQRMQDVHNEIMFMIDREYATRQQQAALIHENVKLLIQAQQYEIAAQIMNRLTALLADSPIKQALSYRDNQLR